MWKILPSKLLLLPLVRHLATAFGGLLAGSGLATSQEAAAIAGGLLALVSVIWGLFEKRSDVQKIENGGH